MIIHWFRINRSGKTVPIFDGALISNSCCAYDKSTAAGTLSVDEFFVLQPNSAFCPSCGLGVCGVSFRGISGYRHDLVHWDDADAAPGYDTSVLNFPLATGTIHGTTQHVFQIQNRSEELRARDGNIIMTLDPGTEIATDTTRMGQTCEDHWLIWDVKRNNVWTYADNRSGHNTWAFVDTGLKVGCRPTTISIRTSLAS